MQQAIVEEADAAIVGKDQAEANSEGHLVPALRKTGNAHDDKAHPATPLGFRSKGEVEGDCQGEMQTPHGG